MVAERQTTDQDSKKKSPAEIIALFPGYITPEAKHLAWKGLDLETQKTIAKAITGDKFSDEQRRSWALDVGDLVMDEVKELVQIIPRRAVPLGIVPREREGVKAEKTEIPADQKPLTREAFDREIAAIAGPNGFYRLENKKSGKVNEKADRSSVDQSTSFLIDRATYSVANGEITIFDNGAPVRVISPSEGAVTPAASEKQVQEPKPEEMKTDEEQTTEAEPTVVEEPTESNPAAEQTLEPERFIPYTDEENFAAMKRKLGDNAKVYALQFSDGRVAYASDKTIGNKIDGTLSWVGENAVASKANPVYPWLSGYRESGRIAYRLEAYESYTKERQWIAKEIASDNFVDIIPLTGREARAHRGEVQQEEKDRKEAEAELKWWEDQRKIDQDFWANHKPYNSDNILFSSGEDGGDRFVGVGAAKEAIENLIQARIQALVTDRQERLRKHAKDDIDIDSQIESLLEVREQLLPIMRSAGTLNQKRLMETWGFSGRLSAKIARADRENIVSSLENHIRNYQKKALDLVILAAAKKIGQAESEQIFRTEVDEKLSDEIIKEFHLGYRLSRRGIEKPNPAGVISDARKEIYRGLESEADLSDRFDHLEEHFGELPDEGELENFGELGKVVTFLAETEELTEINSKIEEILGKLLKYAADSGITVDGKSLAWLHESPFEKDPLKGSDETVIKLMKATTDADFNTYSALQKYKIDALSKAIKGHLQGELKRALIKGSLERLLAMIEENKPDAGGNLFNLVAERNKKVKSILDLITDSDKTRAVVQARDKDAKSDKKKTPAAEESLRKSRENALKKIKDLVTQMEEFGKTIESELHIRNLSIIEVSRVLVATAKSEMRGILEVQNLQEHIDGLLEPSVKGEIDWDEEITEDEDESDEDSDANEADDES